MTIDINKMIRREMKKNYLNASGLAKKLNVHPTTVLGILKRPTIKIERLINLSEVLNYNFFREIADQLPYKARINAHEEEKYRASVEEKYKVYEDRIKELEMEVGILRDTLKSVVTK